MILYAVLPQRHESQTSNTNQLSKYKE